MTELELLAELERLAQLSPTAYEICREAEAEKLGFRLGVLDKEIASRRPHRNDSNTRKGTHEASGAQGLNDGSNEYSNTDPVRTPEELYASAQEIIESRDILTEVDRAVSKMGYAGDRNPGQEARLVIWRAKHSKAGIKITDPKTGKEVFTFVSDDRLVLEAINTVRGILDSMVKLRKEIGPDTKAIPRFAISAIERALKDHPAALDAILKELADGDDEKLN